MGLMGFIFKFSFECFGLLAWPLFAICYPLCASVQAIESNSNFETEKMITYWVCFSLILLFENAFQQLLHWLPYWPYMKLIIVGCLVTPHFNGSFYIYNHFVHPCLSINPRFVFNWLMIKLSEILKQDYPPSEANRESKETEIAFKPGFKDIKIEKKDINVVEITEKSGLSSTKLVRKTEFDLALPRSYAEIVATPIGEVKGLPDLIASKKLQKEMTCATSQADLISQPQGKIHHVNFAGLGGVRIGRRGGRGRARRGRSSGSIALEIPNYVENEAMGNGGNQPDDMESREHGGTDNDDHGGNSADGSGNVGLGGGRRRRRGRRGRRGRSSGAIAAEI